MNVIKPLANLLLSLSLSLGLALSAANANATAAAQAQDEREGFLGKSAEASLKLLFDSPEDYSVTPEQARALPYAAQYIRVGDGVRSMIGLGEVDAMQSGLKLQWFTNAKEVVETHNGRVLSLQNLNDPQVKQLWIIRAGNDYHIDVRVPSPYHTEHKPHYMTKRHSYEVVSLPPAEHQPAVNLAAAETQTLSMPNGSTVNAVITREVLFQNGEPMATNEFYREATTGRAVQSKQWLGPELGYLELTEVQPFAGELQPPTQQVPVLAEAQQANAPTSAAPWAFSPVANDFQQLTTTDGSNPLQYIQVRVTNNGTNNGTNKHTALFYANSRLNQAVTEYHKQGVQQPYYEPLTRLSSAKLEHEFNARKQAMATKLAMLAQTYRHDGDDKKAQQASMLATAFQHWPLKATYIHGMSLANARLDLAQNPVLNTADAATGTSTIPYYELCLNEAPLGQHATQRVGLTATHPEFVYVVDAFGVITKVPMQHYNGNAAQRALAQQPGAVVLYSIDDSELPKGFRDINLQLAQFLQHWDWS